MQKRYTLLYLTGLLFFAQTALGQLVASGNVFLQGQFLECGVQPNGSLGSSVNAPAGYHPHSGGSIGMYTSACSYVSSANFMSSVYDWGHDGWTVGTPHFMGDYTLPGTPYEGWGIEVGGVSRYASATACGFSGASLTGSFTSYSNTGGIIRANWVGSAASGSLSIRKEYRVDTLGSALVVTVTLKNVSAGTLNNIYYFRSSDCDNAESWGGSTYFSTYNTIDYQNDYYHRVMASSAAASTANSFTGTPPAVLSLATKDCRAKAIVYYAWPVSTSTDISTLYSGTASLSFYTAALGPAVDYGTATNDYAIGLVYNLGNLAASDSTVISYAYIYNGATGLDEAFPEPQMYVNGAAHDSTDTITVCAATTLPVSLLHASDKNWTLSHWSWAPTTGLASDTGINNTINVGLLTGPVTYTITGTDSAMGNCAQKVFTLRIIPIFIPNNVSNNGPLCAGSTLQLTETDTLAGVTTYNWVGPNGFTSTQHNPVITGAVYADSGLYTVTITNGPCSSPSSTNVIIYPTPALPVAASPTYCQFVPSVPLSATGTNLLWYTTATGGTGSTVAPTPSTAVAGVFTYYVSQTINGCEGPRLPVIVTVNAKPIPPVITDLPGSYCPGQPFNNFTVVTGTNILWYAGATGGVGSGVAPAVSTASPGTFTYWASQSVLGCESDRSSVSITVFPGVTAAFDTFIHHGCQTDSVDFINQSVNGVQYLWTFGDGSSSTAYSVTPHLYTSQGTYTVTLYAHSGDQCVDSAIKVLPLVHPIVASFTLDSAIVCQGHPVSFRDTSTATMPSYLWSFGDGATSTLKDPAHAYANTGTYNVVLSVTDEFLCSDNTATTVVVDSATVISMTISDTTLCLGNNITVAATFVAQGITAFVWNLGDGDSVVNVNPLTYAYPVTGSYVVTGMARYRACPDVAITRNVNIFAQPMIGLGADTSICEGSEAFSVGDYMNAANPAAHWLWSTGQVTPTITITSAGSYGVTVNIGGCIATDTINVINDCLLALPNIFTPNGDGTNDYFNPRDFMKGITSFDMTIYNRWGQQVFHTDAIQGSGWDGMFNNTPQPEGVYIYQLNATFKDSQRINKTGNFTLIR